MFSELGLHEGLVATLTELGYTDPTPVQQQAIPAALEGRDLMVSSHTGSGKTAAFLLPSLQRMIDDPKPKTGAARLLILTPTRELAQQVEKAARGYGREVKKLNTACLVGGSSYHLQLKDLGRKPEILICTPGRLLDHIERGRVNVAEIETLVLDEADRMLDMGFSDDIEAIVAQLPAERQTLLFSATLEGVVGHLAQRLTRNPLRIEIETQPQQEALIEQRLMMADNAEHKGRLLDAILRDTELQQAVVFTATKRGAEELADQLAEQGFAVAALHGDMHQRARNATLQKLRQARINVLVATDVAARGIDVAGISHVINFDVPRQVEDYVHRIGRTGRAGRSGIAITLAEFRDRRILREIERYTGQLIDVTTIPGLEPTRREERRGEPKRRYGNSNSGGGGGRFKNGHHAGRSNGPRQHADREDSPRQYTERGDSQRQFAERGDSPRPFADRGEAPRRPAGRSEGTRPYASRGDAPRPQARAPRPAAFEAEDSIGNSFDAPAARKPRQEDRGPRKPRQDNGDARPRGERRYGGAANGVPGVDEFSPRRESVQKEFGRKRKPRDNDADFLDEDSRFNRAQPEQLSYHERDPGQNFTARQVAEASQRRAEGKARGKAPGSRDTGGQSRRRDGAQPARDNGFRSNGPRKGGHAAGNRGGQRGRSRDGGFFSRETGYGPSEVQESPRTTRTPRIIKAERPQRTVFYNEKLIDQRERTEADGNQPPRKKLSISRNG